MGGLGRWEATTKVARLLTGNAGKASTGGQLARLFRSRNADTRVAGSSLVPRLTTGALLHGRFFRWRVDQPVGISGPFEKPPEALLSATCFSSSAIRPAQQRADDNQSTTSQKRGAVARQEEDPFDTITDRIPERPVTPAEAGSYSLVIVAGLAVAGIAAYGFFREMFVERQEYAVFNKALQRIKIDQRIIDLLGAPITGYGQEARNRRTRQRISHKAWKDEDGVDRVQVAFHVRGPHGAGVVNCEMFRDREDRNRYKFTYLYVDVLSPTEKRFLLESYMPSADSGLTFSGQR
eukprot:TRINITY_DN9554_c0_g1_i1.p1 TRINITY_DN9554_c0_g1~~TRINITY_DN9554_c0_g1_i1.p1  ORF type:complete len:306 (-),score=22.89 TRINITY_DN9554_c0_g1_i1:364-1242(-)